MTGVRGRLSRLRREASQGALLIRQRDGTIRAFDKMDVMGQVYLARLDAALGRAAWRSEVIRPRTRHAGESPCRRGDELRRLHRRPRAERSYRVRRGPLRAVTRALG